MMYIEVLYADLSRQRQPIEQADLLKKTGVLAIIISASGPDNPRVTIAEVGYSRVAQSIGWDFYYFLKYWDEGAWWYGLEGRNTENLVSFRRDSDKPFDNASLRIEHPRYNCWSMIFEGTYVTDEVWAEAKELFKGVH